MQKIHRMTLLILILFMTAAGISQTIEKVIPGYVLIKADVAVGQVGDVVRVYRFSPRGIRYIGSVKIIRFADNKAAAKIIQEVEGLNIKEGDYISLRIPKILINPEALRTVDRDLRRTNAAVASDDYHKYDTTTNTQISVGRVVPGPLFSETLKASYTVGAAVRIKTFPRHALYLDILYPFFQSRDTFSDIKQTLFMIYVTEHIRLRDRMYYQVGAGFNFAGTSVTDQSGTRNINDTHMGFFLGTDLEVYRSSGWTAAPSVRLYAYKSDTGWHEFATAGLNINFRLF